MPDDDLITLEENGKLRTELEDQVKRMVKDPKSNSFFENFAEQWLALRKLDISSPDYPEETPLNNLWLAMLERFGAPSQKLVDSTGVLGGLS